MGTTREAEAQRIYQEKLAIHHQWVAEQTSIEAERAQLLFYDTVRLTGTVLSDPSTATHLVLDALGMIPVIGEPADGLNALIYLAEGDELNAGRSAAGMIPIGGMAVTGVRAVKTAVSAGMDAVRMVDATSSAISMAVKLDPPTIKPPTGATTPPPAAPVAAAVPPAPKTADSANAATRGSDSPSHYAAQVLPGGRVDGEIVFAGHGVYRVGDGAVTVPEGTTLKVYAEHGDTIEDSLGLAIEAGDDVVPVRTYGPGEVVPDYTLKTPDDLVILEGSVAVTESTRLSALLEPDMGVCHWAACLKVVP
jgi:hypothetical protein